jgi:hypothetical protein
MVGVNVKTVYSLMIMIIVAWLLIIVESYIFFGVIRPLGPALHVGLRLMFLSSLLKIVGTAGLGLGWVGAMLALRAVLVRSKLTRKTPTSSS